MRIIIKKYAIVVIAVFVLTQLIDGFSIANGWTGLLGSCLILTLLFFIARPIINLLTLPINILSLNLFSYLINILLVYIWSALSADVIFTSWKFEGLRFGILNLSASIFPHWQVVILSAIILSIIINILRYIFK